jgi:D-aspartate ligase
MGKKSPPAVIVGLSDASLSLVRSLGRRGVRVIGLHDDSCLHYYAKSRYCSERIRSDSPLYGEKLVKLLLEDVLSLIDEPAVLFCATDKCVLTVSEYERELNPFYRFVLPSHETAQRHIMKRSFHEFATSRSFLVPHTFFSRSAKELEHVMDSLSYPCIIKPDFRGPTWTRKVPVKVLHAESKSAFEDLVREYEIDNLPLIVQEWIDGGDSDVYFCLAYIGRTHRPLAVCTGRKLRQYPALTGSTSLAEAVWLPELAEEALRFLWEADCVGFCSVEFKRSNEDGRFYITEPTIGRPDTQEGVFACAGIDVPYIAYADALGEEVSAGELRDEGVKWVNEPLEFYQLQGHLRQGSSIRKFFSLYGGKRYYSLWSYRDPAPSLAFLKEKAIRGFSRPIRYLMNKQLSKGHF